MNIIIENDRFIMRNLKAEDVQGIYALDADPEVHRYLENQPISTMQRAKDIIIHVQRQYVENGIGRLAVIDKVTGDFKAGRV